MITTIRELKENLLNYISKFEDIKGKVPSKYEFAKECGYCSFKALQRYLATCGDEGRDFLETLDDELKIFFINYQAKATKQAEIINRSKLLSLVGGLQEKQSVDIGLSPITNGSANIDFALLARVNKVADKDFLVAKDKGENNE